MKPKTKKCSTCKEIKSTNDFYANKQNRSKLNYECKICSSERNAAKARAKALADSGDPLINQFLRAKSFSEIFG